MTRGRFNADHSRNCDYCPWPAVSVIMLENGLWRALLGKPRRVRYVCGKHLRRGRNRT